MSDSSSSSDYYGGAQILLPRGNACHACRRRKQKCSGGRPVCQQCLTGDRRYECKWDSSPPSTASTDRLEARVRELEAQVQRRESQLSVSGVRAAPPPVPSPEAVQYLLDVFLQHSYQFDFPAPGFTNAFRQSLSFAMTDPRRPHPALIEAMCLLACRLSTSAPMTHFEPYFLSRATSFLDESLSMVDRLLDFIVATALISRYNFYVGHDVRGMYMASSAATFAVSCGLHALPQSLESLRRTPQSTQGILLPPPDTLACLNRRIHVWWSTCLLDKDVCNFTGRSSDILEEIMTTPMAGQFAQFEDANAPTFCNVSVSNNIGGTPTSETILFYIRLKASALLSQAGSLAQGAMKAKNNSFWARQADLIKKLDAFMVRLPPVTAASLWSETTATFPAETDATRYALVHAYSCYFAAKIQLHGVFSDEAPAEYPLLIQAARNIALVLRMVQDFNARTASFFVAPTWMTARRVLRRDRERLRQSGMDTSAVQKDINTLSGGLQLLSDIFPGLSTYLKEDN